KAVFLQRLYFEAIFSKGFMITTGFEYGFKKRINTVESKPEDWEDTGLDFTKNIKEILTIKENLLPLHEESSIEVIEHSNWANVFCFVKEWDEQRVLAVMNKDTESKQTLKLINVPYILRAKKIKDYSPDNKVKGQIESLDLSLLPGEIKIFASENHWTENTKSEKQE
ncbi:MAG: hypothetical protein MJB14_01870, partial [Spirochaetes bacterium]|nr:hypothetical protein [Spirochaetota bacterium]